MTLVRILSVCVCWRVCAAILAKPADHSNNGTADHQLGDSNKRSAAYGEYYPDNYHPDSFDHGYDLDHGHVFDHGYHPHREPHYPHHEPHYPHPYPPDALKALLIPLAGVALLGAAAVFASNPILLQLGVVSGKRRKRSVAEWGNIPHHKLQDIVLLEKFINQLPADEVVRQERRLVAGYLDNASCVERLVCELYQPHSQAGREERSVIQLVVLEVLNNEFVKDQTKEKILKARRVGRSEGNCQLFSCSELDNSI